MAEALAPVDTSVAIPAAVRAASAKAEAFYQQTPQTPEPTPTPAPEPVVAQTPEPEAPAPIPTPPQVDPVAQVQVDPADRVAELEAALAKQTRDNKALYGRFQQQRDYIAMQQNQLSQLANPRSWAQPAQPTKPLISDEEKKYYGDDFLSVVERKAKETVFPVVSALEQQNQRLHQELSQVKANDVYADLDAAMPNWEQINDSQEWLDWLNLPDLYSGVIRQNLLNAAFEAGDAARVLAFFRGFANEHPEHMGQQAQPSTPAAPSQTPPRKAAIKLTDLAAPGRASPSPPPAVTEAQPTITQKDITAFYRSVQRGEWKGREEAQAKREAFLHAAVRDGRVQFAK